MAVQRMRIGRVHVVLFILEDSTFSIHSLSVMVGSQLMSPTRTSLSESRPTVTDGFTLEVFVPACLLDLIIASEWSLNLSGR